MDIFPIFYILIFAIREIAGKYQICALGKLSRRGNGENLPQSLASRYEPHSEFRWALSHVLGGLGAGTGFCGVKSGFLQVFGDGVNI